MASRKVKVPVGTTFETRMELSKAGIHPPPMNGIYGNTNTGAESVVVSGGYEDDKDDGDIILYTGQGGMEKGKQIADQELERGNLALAKSFERKLPVRVVRGFKLNSPYAPLEGYRYDGEYTVEDFWEEKGKSGFKVYRCKLVRIPGQPPLPMVDPSQRKKRKHSGYSNSFKKSRNSSFEFTIQRKNNNNNNNNINNNLQAIQLEEDERIYINFEEKPMFMSIFNLMLKGICFCCDSKVPGLAPLSHKDPVYFEKLIDHLSDDLADISFSTSTDLVSPEISFSMLNQVNLRMQLESIENNLQNSNQSLSVV